MVRRQPGRLIRRDVGALSKTSGESSLKNNDESLCLVGGKRSHNAESYVSEPARAALHRSLCRQPVSQARSTASAGPMRPLAKVDDVATGLRGIRLGPGGGRLQVGGDHNCWQLCRFSA